MAEIEHCPHVTIKAPKDSGLQTQTAIVEHEGTAASTSFSSQSLKEMRVREHYSDLPVSSYLTKHEQSALSAAKLSREANECREVRAIGSLSTTPSACTETQDRIRSADDLAERLTDSFNSLRSGNTNTISQFYADLKKTLTAAYRQDGLEGTTRFLASINSKINIPGVRLEANQENDNLKVALITDRANQAGAENADLIHQIASAGTGGMVTLDLKSIDKSEKQMKELGHIIGQPETAAKGLALLLLDDISEQKELGHTGVSESWARNAASLASTVGSAFGGLEIVNDKIAEALAGSDVSVKLDHTNSRLAHGRQPVEKNTVIVRSLKNNLAAYYEDVRDLSGVIESSTNINVFADRMQ